MKIKQYSITRLSRDNIKIKYIIKYNADQRLCFTGRMGFSVDQNIFNTRKIFSTRIALVHFVSGFLRLVYGIVVFIHRFFRRQHHMANIAFHLDHVFEINVFVPRCIRRKRTVTIVTVKCARRICIVHYQMVFHFVHSIKISITLDTLKLQRGQFMMVIDVPFETQLV